MDNLTHSLVGAVIGQTGLKRKTGLGMAALILGANLPDIDATCFFWLEGTEHLGFRRGITHGPPALVVLPLVLASLLWGFDRWQGGRGKRPKGRLPVHFGWLYALGFIGCLSHPALDWLNVYGIRLLEPFSSEWFYGDTLFIIDVWLWAMLIASVWRSRRAEKRGGKPRRAAWIGLAAMSAYIAANGLITREAEQLELINDDYGKTIASPVPFVFWERELIFPQGEGRVAILPGHAGFIKPGGKVSRPFDVPLSACDLEMAASKDTQIAAFLFWSRTPFLTLEEGGRVMLRDARFYDPRARERFSVEVPRAMCEELPID